MRGRPTQPHCGRSPDRRPLAARILSFSILAILLLGPSSNAFDQESPALARLEVALWPEYDRPAVLVMLRGWLAEGHSKPATVPLPIPTQVGAPHAVAKRGPDRNLLVAPYTVDPAGPWSRVLVVTDMPEFRLEYYQDLIITDSQRQLLFEWPGGLEIHQVVFEVMQPIGSTDLSVAPAAARRQIGPDGMTYHVGELGVIRSDAAFTVAVTYTKDGPGLTVAALQPLPGMAGSFADEPSGSAPVSAETDDDVGARFPWMVVIVVFVIGAATGAWIFRSIKTPQRKD